MKELIYWKVVEKVKDVADNNLEDMIYALEHDISVLEEKVVEKKQIVDYLKIIEENLTDIEC